MSWRDCIPQTNAERLAAYGLKLAAHKAQAGRAEDQDHQTVAAEHHRRYQRGLTVQAKAKVLGRRKRLAVVPALTTAAKPQ